jgi:hypothetical protein
MVEIQRIDGQGADSLPPIPFKSRGDEDVGRPT